MSGTRNRFSHADVARAIENNDLESMRGWSRWEPVALRSQRGLEWLESDIPLGMFNRVLGTNLAPAELPSRIEERVADADARGVPLSWLVSPAATPPDLAEQLGRSGFVLCEERQGMAVALARLEEPATAATSVRIEEVTDEHRLEEWCRIVADVFQLPQIGRQVWPVLQDAMGYGPETPRRLFVAFLERRPVATASLNLGIGAAGIAAVATLPEVRRRGIGTAVTLTALREAGRLGVHTGVLFSNPAVVPFYRRFGFREYYRDRIYLRQRSCGSGPGSPSKEATRP